MITRISANTYSTTTLEGFIKLGKQIEEVELLFNILTVDEVESIITGLKSNTILTQFTIAANTISSKDLSLIIYELNKFSTIKTVSLHFGEVEGSDVSALRILANNSSIIKLVLDFPTIDFSQEIDHILAYNYTIARLNVSTSSQNSIMNEKRVIRSENELENKKIAFQMLENGFASYFERETNIANGSLSQFSKDSILRKAAIHMYDKYTPSFLKHILSTNPSAQNIDSLIKTISQSQEYDIFELAGISKQSYLTILLKFLWEKIFSYVQIKNILNTEAKKVAYQKALDQQKTMEDTLREGVTDVASSTEDVLDPTELEVAVAGVIPE